MLAANQAIAIGPNFTECGQLGPNGRIEKTSRFLQAMKLIPARLPSRRPNRAPQPRP